MFASFNGEPFLSVAEKLSRVFRLEEERGGEFQGFAFIPDGMGCRWNGRLLEGSNKLGVFGLEASRGGHIAFGEAVRENICD